MYAELLCDGCEAGAVDTADPDVCPVEGLCDVRPHGLQPLAVAAPWRVEHDEPLAAVATHLHELVAQLEHPGRIGSVQQHVHRTRCNTSHNTCCVHERGRRRESLCSRTQPARPPAYSPANGTNTNSLAAAEFIFLQLPASHTNPHPSHLINCMLRLLQPVPLSSLLHSTFIRTLNNTLVTDTFTNAYAQSMF